MLIILGRIFFVFLKPYVIDIEITNNYNILCGSGLGLARK